MGHDFGANLEIGWNKFVSDVVHGVGGGGEAGWDVVYSRQERGVRKDWCREVFGRGEVVANRQLLCYNSEARACSSVG